ncbi:major facilitator superfamily precursor [Vibrio astriarenae]|nr:major facilitator superfamily precursor [Vibrio sp. C7]
MTVRDALPIEEQESFVMYTSASINEELDPRTEYNLQSLYLEDALSELDDIRDGESSEIIAYINRLVTQYPEWVGPLTEKAVVIDNVDLIVLYRSLSLTHPELSADIASAIASAEDSKLIELIQWLISKEPENTMEILVALAEQEEQSQVIVLESLAESSPDRVAEFSQEVTANVIESVENMRPADRNGVDVLETLSDFINHAADTVPEHAEMVVEAVEQALDDVGDLSVDITASEIVDVISTAKLENSSS